MQEREEKSHFEIMEELGQLTIFDIENYKHEPATPSEPNNTQDQVTNETSSYSTNTESDVREGDSVTVSIPTESEDYEYFKYYYPHALTGRGEVEKIENQLCHVRFRSDVLLFRQHELTL